MLIQKSSFRSQHAKINDSGQALSMRSQQVFRPFLEEPRGFTHPLDYCLNSYHRHFSPARMWTNTTQQGSSAHHHRSASIRYTFPVRSSLHTLSLPVFIRSSNNASSIVFSFFSFHSSHSLFRFTPHTLSFHSVRLVIEWKISWEMWKSIHRHLRPDHSQQPTEDRACR